MPELRIVDAAIWTEVRTRIDRGRDLQGRKPASRPPSTLFGGIMKCPHCTRTLTAVDAQNYGCGRAKDRGPTVCIGFGVRRKIVDSRLTKVIQSELLSTEAATEFATAFEQKRAQLESPQTEALLVFKNSKQKYRD